MVQVINDVPLAGERSIGAVGMFVLLALFIVLQVMLLYPPLSITNQVYLYAQSVLIPVCVVVKSHLLVSYFVRLEL